MTECVKCGKCCEEIFLSAYQYQLAFDPEFDVSPGNKQDADFISQYWHPYSRSDEQIILHCDFYNWETKLCEAYEKRPPVCSNFPWYGRGPTKGYLPKKCSFNADIPVEIGKKENV